METSSREGGGEIPIIDLEGVRRGDRAAMIRTAAAVRSACTGVGFFYVTHHGVPEAVIAETVAQARVFFALPPERKREVAANARHRGFHALGDALMYEATRPDHKEFYSMGLELPEDDPDVVAGEPLRGPNNWPKDMPAFRAALAAYYDAMGACGADLLRCVALSLDRPEDFFASRYRKRLQRTQIIYYPPQPPELGDEQFGVAPHSDFGCITLLWQDQNGGLEVLERSSRRWIPARPIPGTLVVNVGDLLERWTNNLYASTPHRVVNRSGRERYSIATFYDPDFKAVMNPRDFGFAPEEIRTTPTTAGAHILGRIEKSFGYRKTLKATA